MVVGQHNESLVTGHSDGSKRHLFMHIKADEVARSRTRVSSSDVTLTSSQETVRSSFIKR